jgi:predicted RNase H-like nuclease
MSSDATMLYGVDAARNGWVVARSSPDLRDVSIYLIPELEPLFWRVIRDRGLLAIDIPIGLPRSSPRACDIEARRLLGRPRGSSVFPAPMRETLHAESYPEACRLNEAASGRKISQQTYRLLPRLREVDSLMWVDRQERIFEAHPELSFMLIAEDTRGLASKKKRSAGKLQRLELIERALPDVNLDAVLEMLPNRIASLDDRLDALACLITASRIHQGKALRVPENEVEFDDRSLRMEIFA